MPQSSLRHKHALPMPGCPKIVMQASKMADARRFLSFDSRSPGELKAFSALPPSASFSNFCEKIPSFFLREMERCLRVLDFGIVKVCQKQIRSLRLALRKQSTACHRGSQDADMIPGRDCRMMYKSNSQELRSGDLIWRIGLLQQCGRSSTGGKQHYG
jgi:hypothetical protein